MPHSTFVEIPQEEQAQMLATLRRARYGYLLALHILLWCAAGHSPTDIAAALFCSRSRVYRTVHAYQEGPLGLEHDDQGRLVPPVRTTVLFPTRRRSLLSLLKAPPRAYGWCRTRWSCATLALTWQATRGITVSAETLRRWVHEVGWGVEAPPIGRDRRRSPPRGALGPQPRFTRLWWPTSCPRANPMERAFGDVHDGCTRNHRRNRLPDLVADVEDHVHLNGPWKYQLSDLSYEPAITAAVENIAAEEHAKAAA